MNIKTIFLIAICFQALTTTIKPKEIKNIVVEYDQDGLPTINSLKEILFGTYLNEENKNLIFIEKISGETNNSAVYLIKVNNHPIFYLKIRFNSQSDSIKDEINFLAEDIKKSDYDGSYPFFIPDNLPINILLENLFSYQDQENNKRFIELFLITN